LNLLEQAHSVADAAMEALLAEEGVTKEASSPKKSKSKKASPRLDLRLATSAPLPLASGCAILPEEPTADARADEALKHAMAGGDSDALARALEAHRNMASEEVLQKARVERDRLAKMRKKESQRLRKAHAGAMSALPQLQALDELGDFSALQEGLASATAHEGVLPALDEELEAARVRLEQLAAGDGSATTELAGPAQAWELTLDDLGGV
jgi:interleukin-1 receptor-associated kinase 1